MLITRAAPRVRTARARASALALLALALPAWAAEPTSAAKRPPSIDPNLITLPGYVKPADRNAAIRYWQAFTMFTDKQNEVIANVNWIAIGTTFDADAMHESYNAAVDLKINPAIFDVLLEAASSPRCNWEIAHEHGFNALMPHLAQMRRVARLMRFAARDAIVTHNNPDRAAEHIGAIIAMSRHTASDPTLISVLVGTAILFLATHEAEMLAESGRLTPAARDALLAAFRALPEHEPLNYTAALRGERDLMLTWGEYALASPEARREFAREYGAVNTKAAGLAAMTTEHMRADIQKCRDAFNLLLAAWDDPDPLPAIRAVGERVESMEFGIFAAVVFPAVEMLHKSRERTRDAVANAIRALEAAAVTPAAAPPPAP